MHKAILRWKERKDYQFWTCFLSSLPGETWQRGSIRTTNKYKSHTIEILHCWMHLEYGRHLHRDLATNIIPRMQNIPTPDFGYICIVQCEMPLRDASDRKHAFIINGTVYVRIRIKSSGIIWIWTVRICIAEWLAGRLAHLHDGLGWLAWRSRDFMDV
jgi:hypothetical protein